MSAFHKESVTNLSENNNNNNISNTSSCNSKSKSRAKSNNNPSNEKLHGCQYCKKSFVSPAKLRLHTAKFHAEQRLSEVQPPIADLHQQSVADNAGPGGTDARLRFYDDSGPGPRYPSPSSSDGLPSQQVPEMEMSYINSSPETDMSSNVSEFPSKDHLPSLGGNSYSSIPTIHIPEFDHIQSRMGDNGEISTEAIQALLFS